MMTFIHQRLFIQQNGLFLLFILSAPAWAMDMDGMSETHMSMHATHTQNISSSDTAKTKSHHAREAASIVDHSSTSPIASDMISMHHTSVQQKQDLGHSDIHHETTGMNDIAPTRDMDHSSMSGMSMTTHTSPMQGGTAPENARSSDYSQGRDFGSIHPPMMMGNDQFMSLAVKRLEALQNNDPNQGAYEIEGWWGDDWNRVVVKAEGEVDDQRLSQARTELIWRKPLDTFWNTELGIRQDSGYPNNRTWLSLGIDGISPYWVKLDATVYMRDHGQTTMILTGEYDWRITQRLILQPSIEIRFYGKTDRINGIGKGLSKAESGLRLRYEISRQFAPYIGFERNQHYGQTADLLTGLNQKSGQSQAVAGVMFWF